MVDLDDGNSLVTLIFSKAFTVNLKNSFKNSACQLMRMNDL